MVAHLAAGVLMAWWQTSSIWVPSVGRPARSPVDRPSAGCLLGRLTGLR
jgi:hypothetical protein